MYGIDTAVLEMQTEDGFNEQEATGSCMEKHSPEDAARN